MVRLDSRSTSYCSMLFAAVEVSSEAIAIADAEHRILYSNSAFALMHGYTVEEIVGIPVSVFHPPEEQEKLKLILGELLKKSFYSCEFRNVTKTGCIFPTTMNNSLVRDDDGNVLAFLGSFRDNTGIKQMEERLIMQRDRLRDLASQLTIVAEQERRRLAIVLHDNVKQTIAFAKMRVGTLIGQTDLLEIAAGLDAVKTILDQALRETRTLEFELSPLALRPGIPFRQAIQWLVKNVEQKRGLNCHLAMNDDTGTISEELKLVLFKAIRELLINVVKHAAVDEVFVDIRKVGQNIEVEVLDHGAGFDVKVLDVMDPRSKGFGLFSMQERFADFGGSVDVSSELGRGTRVLLVIPVSA